MFKAVRCLASVDGVGFQWPHYRAFTGDEVGTGARLTRGRQR